MSHAKDIEEWRDRWPKSSGRTGGVHVDVLCDDGVEQAMGQRSSFTEELVHGLVDPALVSAKLLCRPVGSRAAALGRHGDAVNERRCGVRWGAQRRQRDNGFFIARRLGPEKVRLQSRRR